MMLKNKHERIFSSTPFYAYFLYPIAIFQHPKCIFHSSLSSLSLSMSPLRSSLAHLIIALRWLWPFPVALHYQTLISLLVQPSGHPWGHFTEVDISDNVLPVTQVSHKQRRGACAHTYTIRPAHNDPLCARLTEMWTLEQIKMSVGGRNILLDEREGEKRDNVFSSEYYKRARTHNFSIPFGLYAC